MKKQIAEIFTNNFFFLSQACRPVKTLSTWPKPKVRRRPRGVAACRVIIPSTTISNNRQPSISSILARPRDKKHSCERDSGARCSISSSHPPQIKCRRSARPSSTFPLTLPSLVSPGDEREFSTKGDDAWKTLRFWSNDSLRSCEWLYNFTTDTEILTRETFVTCFRFTDHHWYIVLTSDVSSNCFTDRR